MATGDRVFAVNQLQDLYLDARYEKQLHRTSPNALPVPTTFKEDIGFTTCSTIDDVIKHQHPMLVHPTTNTVPSESDEATKFASGPDLPGGFLGFSPGLRGFKGPPAKSSRSKIDGRGWGGRNGLAGDRKRETGGEGGRRTNRKISAGAGSSKKVALLMSVRAKAPRK
ncbi:hypothetical protein EVAR_60387_1 [Eumeta japonica]|uniref:Uncharacterized protein n=1 Tax=Eumeta variegata TaxID=151549 RepID=A0A4C2A830_EUMVA|nr:hypothetical protein EVAR_60387_1 [Eumeta japonica]